VKYIFTAYGAVAWCVAAFWWSFAAHSVQAEEITQKPEQVSVQETFSDEDREIIQNLELLQHLELFLQDDLDMIQNLDIFLSNS